jgi:hypothetical protein
MSRPLVAVADLHGQRSLFDQLLARFDELLGDGYDLVTLGDYADNGPEVPELLDRLIELKASRPDRFFPVMGNHDLACLRAVGWEGGPPDQGWFERMRRRYWNRGLGTDTAYGARDASSVAGRMPKAHGTSSRPCPGASKPRTTPSSTPACCRNRCAHSSKTWARESSCRPSICTRSCARRRSRPSALPTGAKSSSAAIRADLACSSRATRTRRTSPTAGASACRPRWTRAASCSRCCCQSVVSFLSAKASLSASRRRCVSRGVRRRG